MICTNLAGNEVLHKTMDKDTPLGTLRVAVEVALPDLAEKRMARDGGFYTQEEFLTEDPSSGQLNWAVAPAQLGSKLLADGELLMDDSKRLSDLSKEAWNSPFHVLRSILAPSKKGSQLQITQQDWLQPGSTLRLNSLSVWYCRWDVKQSIDVGQMMPQEGKKRIAGAFRLRSGREDIKPQTQLHWYYQGGERNKKPRRKRKNKENLASPMYVNLFYRAL